MLVLLNTYPHLTAELIARFDSRKSFYKKALVHFSPDTHVLTLQSYETTVAMFNNYSQELTLGGYYSNTTNRHIWEFMRQIEAESELDILSAYRDICKNEKLNSFVQFLENIAIINLKEKTYTLRNTRKTFKY